MATKIPATTKNSPAIARPREVHNNDATAYAPPHKMTGEKISPKTDSFVTKDPNKLTAGELGFKEGTPRVSMGDPGKDNVKHDGIEMRGAGAATKGRISRGPMA
jgi:hypothetical protein